MDFEKSTGALSLTFRRKSTGQTYIADQYFKIPMQIMPPHYQDDDGTAFVYLLNTGGGVLHNDRYMTEIIAEEGSRVLITSPSSNKLYKMEDGHAELINHITVKEGAVMEYLPEHNVPYARSHTYQENEFHLDKSAVLIASDMVTAGRVAMGEVFEYELYASRTKIYVDGKLRVYDNSRMDPETISMEKLGYMEGYLTNGTIYVYSEGLDDTLPQKLNSMEHDGNVKFAAGKIDDDFMIIRFLGNSMIDLKEMIDTVWGKLRKELLGKEAVRIRKY